MIWLGLLLLRVAQATPCLDGWQSPSTGSGTCSHHGGIDHSKDVNVPYRYTPAPTYTPPATTTDETTVDVVNVCGEVVIGVTYYEDHIFKGLILLGEDKDIARFYRVYRDIGTNRCSTLKGDPWGLIWEQEINPVTFVKDFSNGIEVVFKYTPNDHIVSIVIH